MNTDLLFNPVVTEFLNDLDHPRRNEIERLRQIILSADPGLSENIKWNGPNYTFRNEDRITMKIFPPGRIQLVFHRGAKKQNMPESPVINEDSGFLMWKENDRAIASFTDMNEIINHSDVLTSCIQKWIQATV